MRLLRPLICVIAIGLMALSSCSRDPNVLKKRYLESGNKYFERGKYRSAILLYRDALQKDKTFGEAHYRLGLTYLKLNSLQEGVRSLLRASQFLDKNDPHYWDSVIRIATIYVNVGGRNKSLMDEVGKYVALLLAHDANSFEGHHLNGELLNIRALEPFRMGLKDQARKQLEDALEEYRKADSIKPNQPVVLMEIAGVYSLEENYDSAEQTYRKVLDADKTYVMGYVELFNLAIKRNRMDLAEQTLKDGYKNNPKQYLFLERLATFYWAQHRPEDVAKALQEMKSHAKDYPRAYLDVGDFYYRQGDADSALREFREGMSKDPKQRALYQKHMVEVLVRQNRKPEAASLVEQILNENPNDSEAKSLDGSLKLEKGDVAHALSELQQAVTQAPDNAIAHFNLGRAYAVKGDLEQARQQFDRAIELRTDLMPARLALAELEATRGEYESAIKAAQAALSLDPNNLAAHLIQTAALVGQKKYSDARSMLDALLVSNPNSPDIMFQLAIVDMAENKYKEAETRFRKVYELNPSNPRGLLGLVETLLSQGKIDQALATIKTESEKAPARLDLQVLMADTARRTGKFDMALQYYQHVVDSLEKGSKQRANILVRMGEVNRQRSNYQEAIGQFEKARDIAPESIGVLVELGLTLDAAKQWTQAEKVYEAALKLNPNQPVALNNQAFLLAEHGGDLNRAQTLAQRAKQFMPDRPEVSDTLGWIYLKRNLANNAVDIFKDLVRTNPHSSTFRYHLCQAYNQQGDKAAASRECGAALKENPPAEEAKDIKDLLGRVSN